MIVVRFGKSLDYDIFPETNIAPENGPSQKGNNRIPTIHFQV